MNFNTGISNITVIGANNCRSPLPMTMYVLLWIGAEIVFHCEQIDNKIDGTGDSQ